jgi:tetratricopeptide (TPR) repeat protein
MPDKVLNRLLAIVICAASLVVYVITMPPTTSFWDSGEFIATSYILGIPHSPGTPLYVLVGRVFSMLPLPMSIAERVNLLSVVFGSLGILMVYLISVAVIRFMYGEATSRLGRFIQYVGPATGSLFLAFSSTYWTDATEAEVYSLSAFLMGFCTLIVLLWYKNPSGEIDKAALDEARRKGDNGESNISIGDLQRRERNHSRNLIYLIIYLLSLGIGFHLGTVLVFGAIFLMLLMVRGKVFSNKELIVFAFGLAVVVADMTLHRQSNLTIVGLVIFAILIVWSTVTEGKFALTATALFILGISVHFYLLIRSGLNPAIDEVDPENWRSLYAHLRREQYPPINVFARKASFLFQIKHFGNYFQEQFRMFGDLMLGSINLGKAAVAIPTALGFYGIYANFQRERRTWVLNFTNLALNSIGLVLFLNFSDEEVRERDYFYGGAFYFFSIFIGIGVTALLTLFWEMAKEKGANAVRYVVPVGVILLVLSIMPANYHWYTHDRSEDYIPRDYAYNMLAGLEPDAIIFTYGDNDTFPLWYIQTVEGYRTDVRVANLSLLNTSWYIRQLRDEEPKVPMTYTDAEIDRIRPLALKGGGVAWKRDQVVNHIIQTAMWKRPIYFAVTVSPEAWRPYNDYLVMEGMVRKLHPYKGTELDNSYMIARNFGELFKYRGVLTEDGEIDDTVYKDADTRAMFQNFSIAVSQLAQNLAMEGKHQEALPWIEMALKFSPSFSWARNFIGGFYMMAGEADRAREYYLEQTRENPNDGASWLGLSRVYEFEGRLDLAMQNLDEGLRLDPLNKQLYINAFRIAARLGQRETAIQYLQRWLQREPNDPEVRAVMQDIDSILEREFNLKPPGERSSEKVGE